MRATASAYDAIDTEALNRRGILLTNTPIPVRHAVASIAVAFILTLSLRMPIKSRLAREGRWRERANYPGVGLPGRTLGIVGLGGIGRELVRLMQPYGMTILAADPHVGSAAAADVGVELCSLEELMKRSDFVVVACLLNKETRHLLNPARLALMKPTAYLINVARGPIVDEEALIAALREDRIAGAGLDVFEQEPPDPANLSSQWTTSYPPPTTSAGPILSSTPSPGMRSPGSSTWSRAACPISSSISRRRPIRAFERGAWCDLVAKVKASIPFIGGANRKPPCHALLRRVK